MITFHGMNTHLFWNMKSIAVLLVLLPLSIGGPAWVPSSINLKRAIWTFHTVGKQFPGLIPYERVRAFTKVKCIKSIPFIKFQELGILFFWSATIACVVFVLFLNRKNAFKMRFPKSSTCSTMQSDCTHFSKLEQ